MTFETQRFGQLVFRPLMAWICLEKSERWCDTALLVARRFADE